MVCLAFHVGSACCAASGEGMPCRSLGARVACQGLLMLSSLTPQVPPAVQYRRQHALRGALFRVALFGT